MFLYSTYQEKVSCTKLVLPSSYFDCQIMCARLFFSGVRPPARAVFDPRVDLATSHLDSLSLMSGGGSGGAAAGRVLVAEAKLVSSYTRQRPTRITKGAEFVVKSKLHPSPNLPP